MVETEKSILEANSNDAEHYFLNKDIENILREYLKKLSNDQLNSKRLVFDADLLEKRLKKYKHWLCPLVSNEKPLFLWDCSQTMGWNLGLLITDQRLISIYPPEDGIQGSRITWSEIKSVVMEGNFLWINGRKFFEIKKAIKDSLKLFVELLQTAGCSSKHKAENYEEVQTIADEKWETIKESEEPIVLIFPYKEEDGPDDIASNCIGELYEGYHFGSRIKFLKVYHQTSPMIIEKCKVTRVPSVAIVRQGVVLANVTGQLGYELRKNTAEAIDRVLETFKEKDGTAKLQEQSLKEQKKAVRDTNFTNWSNAFISGLVAGLVFFFARTKLEGAATLIVPGLAMAFFITNKNFSFSSLQKAFAIVLMLGIGTFGPDIWNIVKWLINS